MRFLVFCGIVVCINALICYGLNFRKARGGLSKPGDNDEIEIKKAVLKQAKMNKEIAQAAKENAEISTDEAQLSQDSESVWENLATITNIRDETRPFVFNARKARDDAIIAERNAKRAAEKTKEQLIYVSELADKVANEAADKVVEQVKQEAIEAAKKADADRKAHFESEKSSRITSAVASAMQPYHLAQLRAQKNAAQFHAKAMSAMDAAKNLTEKANATAAEAQAMQSKGFTFQASQLMMQAHDMMNGAVNLKGQAENLYNIANDINKTVGHYQLSASMAAANADATTSVNNPPSLPV